MAGELLAERLGYRQFRLYWSSDIAGVEPALGIGGVQLRATQVAAELEIIAVGAELRAMMPWLKKDQLVDKNKN